MLLDRLIPGLSTLRGVGLADISQALEKASTNATGGYVERGSEMFVIRSLGIFNGLDDVRRVRHLPEDPRQPAGSLVLEFGTRVGLLFDPVLRHDDDRAQRDVLVVHPRGDTSRPREGVYSTRSPHRPNPIGLHRVLVVAVEGLRVQVDHLEALHGTPIVDVKPVLNEDIDGR